MKQAYEFINFHSKSRARIAVCNEIIAEYQEQGLRLTLRQLYYQLVSRNVIANVEKEYKNLGNLISDARLAGLIDWDAIEDRIREPIQWAEYSDMRELLSETVETYRLPRWAGQKNYVELWIEKSALAGVLQPLASKYHVTLMVNRGYSSSSAMYDGAQRFLAQQEEGKTLILFYLGDHDPSGEDMVRDIEDRMQRFGLHDLRLEKLALTMQQVRHYKLPNNPAKIADSRAKNYIAQHGRHCWEVDALNPRILTETVESAFQAVTDVKKMDKIIKREQTEIAALKAEIPRIMKRLQGA